MGAILIPVNLVNLQNVRFRNKYSLSLFKAGYMMPSYEFCIICTLNCTVGGDPQNDYVYDESSGYVSDLEPINAFATCVPLTTLPR